jgi:uncharacterized protein YbjT (DUF2867 family)
MSKLITVFGATGNQGGSVIKNILADATLSQEFKIRGITRDASKPAAQDLARKGVEMVTVRIKLEICRFSNVTKKDQADMNSKPDLTSALEGSHTVFLVTNYWETASRDAEVTQGKNVTDVAKEVGVKHLIFSSLLDVTKTTNGRLSHVPHFDGKAEIENYIRESGLPATFYLPGYFMSNFAMMVRKGKDGTLTLAYPVGKGAKFPLIDVAEDTGMFLHPSGYAQPANHHLIRKIYQRHH